ncbi:MAG TPA: hypothetical protein VE781_14150 [Kineosporiaceae bacterium]|nr:hypothetical protein [Kineosporiaceae bacterium]
MTARGHRGFLIFMQFLHRKGTFCRDCGTAITRSMSARTLLLGWWGLVSVFVTPVVLLWNANVLRRLGRLPKGTPPSEDWTVPSLDPGPSLWRRPAIAGLLLPVAAVGLVIATTTRAPDAGEYAAGGRPQSGDVVRRIPTAVVGDCWQGSSGSGFEKVACTEKHDVQVFWTEPARSFASYRDAGQKLVSGSAQADAACNAAARRAAWSKTAPQSLSLGDIYPTEEALNSSSASPEDVQIVCYVDSAAAGAQTASLLGG